MYIRIGDKTYTKIASLTFAPSTDLTGTSIPANEFAVDLNIEDAISVNIGNYIRLYDDNHTLWANYWIVYAQNVRFDRVRIRAQSEVSLLDRVTLPAVYYNAQSVSTVLQSVIVYQRNGTTYTLPYTLDSAYSSATITGFCPEQTARERLLWICLVLGAYVKTCFNDRIEILPIPSGIDFIPKNKTYWRPQISATDYVTAIRATTYQFEVGEPYVTDQWVQDANGTVYVIATGEVTLTNPNAPAKAPTNVVSIDGVYLINSGNVSAILNRLAGMYFNRVVVNADVIDNAEYIPGGTVMLYSDDKTLYSGTIQSTDFSFGLQSEGKLRLVSATEYGSSLPPTGELILPPTVVWARFYDGTTLLYATTVPVGGTPAYGGNAPTRGNDTFLGWSPTIGPITRSTSYYAQWQVNGDSFEEIPLLPEIPYEEEPEQMVWAVFADGATIIGAVEVAKGDTPIYMGDMPTRDNDIFIGWEPPLIPIFEDTTFFAQWEDAGASEDELPEESGLYWATFIDGEEILQKTSVPEGETPVYTGETPTKSGNSFDGWLPEPDAIYADTEYYAQWEYMSASLVITYMYGYIQLDRQEYFYPVDYEYSIDNEYIDTYLNDHHYIFRPTTAKTEGTMEAGENNKTVECAVALDEYDGTLEIISVDSVTTKTEGGKTVGVIA